AGAVGRKGEASQIGRVARVVVSGSYRNGAVAAGPGGGKHQFGRGAAGAIADRQQTGAQSGVVAGVIDSIAQACDGVVDAGLDIDGERLVADREGEFAGADLGCGGAEVFRGELVRG